MPRIFSYEPASPKFRLPANGVCWVISTRSTAAAAWLPLNIRARAANHARIILALPVYSR